MTRTGEKRRKSNHDAGRLVGIARFLHVENADRWQMQDAKARFSTLVARAMSGKPQCVTRHGKEAVLVISDEDFLEATRPRENLHEFFHKALCRVDSFPGFPTPIGPPYI